MISVLLITILAIGLAAAAGYGMLTLVKTSDLALTVQRNQIRMDAVAAGIAARVTVDPEGRVLVPLFAQGEPAQTGGDPLPSGTPVPAFAPFKRTAWGDEVVYCPVAYGDVGNAPAGSTDLGDYLARTVGTDDGTFLVSGRPEFAAPPSDLSDDFRALEQADIERMGAVGFLISPAPTRTADQAIACGDVFISLSGEHLTATHGTVTPISGLAAGSALMLRQSTSVRLVPLSADATDRPGVIETVGEALEWAQRFDTSRLDIEFAAGTYALDADDLSALSSMSGRLDLRLRSPGLGTAVLDFGSVGPGSASLTASGRIELSNIELKASSADVGIVAVPGGDVRLEGSRVGFLRVAGGSARLHTTEVEPLHAAAARALPVAVYGGSLTLEDGTSIVAPTAQAAVAASGGDVTVLGRTVVQVLEGGRAFATGQGARILPGFAESANPTMVNLNGVDVPVVSSVRFGSGSEGLGISGHGSDRRMPVKRSTTCGEGGRSCAVTCGAEGEYVAWGECLSGNDAPLAAFGATEDRRGWSCRWAAGSVPSTPTASVVCQGAAWPSTTVRQ